MAKTKLFAKDIPVSFNLSHVVAEDFIRTAIDREVEKAIEAAVADAVGEAVTALVGRIGQERIGREIERVMAQCGSILAIPQEKWTQLNQLHDRLGQLSELSYDLSRFAAVAEQITCALNEAEKLNLPMDKLLAFMKVVQPEDD